MTGSRPQSVLIAGGGIAGVTCALVMARGGYETTVFERAPDFSEVGAGLQISPNITRTLEKLDVLDDLRQIAVEPESLSLKFARSGTVLSELPLKRYAAERWNAPYLTAHRADLLQVLIDAAHRQGNVSLNNAKTIDGFGFQEDKPHLRFSGAEVVSGDLVIGADGVWSKVRTSHTGSSLDQFSGYTAWRKTISSDVIDGTIVSGNSVTAFLDPNAHLVCYPISRGRSVNLVAVTKGKATVRDWSVPANPDALLQTSSKWHPALNDLVHGHGEWLGWPIHTVDPDFHWTDRRGIALIGDAAHAMTPFSAQGAAMAIEDAAVLGLCLDQTEGKIGPALAAYEEARKPRIAMVARRGAFNRFTWHASGPVAIARNLILRYGPEALQTNRLEAIYGWKLDS